ncbi:(2Fe-2S)-binding protein [Ramlibacter rhizophilus]|uniref:Bacterioferritin-associated ferredoxin n=1 Tax=Ramlibacter rhizophilus TaxID=1781167 RepID=A0A4Z0BKL5_9BURK|nr:(2Fe-2S)-binding protein [Ramlibacter rhizophilus]TFY98807.1 ferredoxin [Ramlibacter rhizophilus]
MIVCVCNRVSDRDIARHVHAGMDFSDIQLELGVATQCGQCEGCAREVVAQCSPCHPVAGLQSTRPAVQRPVWISSSASA